MVLWLSIWAVQMNWTCEFSNNIVRNLQTPFSKSWNRLSVSAFDVLLFQYLQPLNPNPDSQWLAFFKDNEVLLQIDKDCRYYCSVYLMFFCGGRGGGGNKVLQNNCLNFVVNYKLQISVHDWLQSCHAHHHLLFCRRLCPDISFFQIATKHPNKKVTTGE